MARDNGRKADEARRRRHVAGLLKSKAAARATPPYSRKLIYACFLPGQAHGHASLRTWSQRIEMTLSSTASACMTVTCKVMSTCDRVGRRAAFAPLQLNSVNVSICIQSCCLVWCGPEPNAVTTTVVHKPGNSSELRVSYNSPATLLHV